MNNTLELLFFASALIGLLISISLMLKIFTQEKAPFFLGLVVLLLSVELFFSWGAQSGYNNREGAFPIWILLNYLLLPPALWIFVKFQTEDNFKLHLRHLWLFLPAVIELILGIYSYYHPLNLGQYPLWTWITQYLPLIGFSGVLIYFWSSFIRRYGKPSEKKGKRFWLAHTRLITLMCSLSLIALFWILFSFVGWQYYYLIELILAGLFFFLALLSFLEFQTYRLPAKQAEHPEFTNYHDQAELQRLQQTLETEHPYLDPNLSLKAMAADLKLPPRYLSYLINRYHEKNFREFINEYRIKAFLEKARSGEEDHKTLLGLALDSGFSSKSTFNQVFKKHTGKTPSAYLKP